MTFAMLALIASWIGTTLPSSDSPDEVEVGLVGERDDRHLAERVGQRPRLARHDPALPGRAADGRELGAGACSP